MLERDNEQMPLADRVAVPAGIPEISSSQGSHPRQVMDEDVIPVFVILIEEAVLVMREFPSCWS